MTTWEYAIWGLFGGFAVEGLEFSGAIRRTGGWPWHQPDEPGLAPLAVSVVIRLVIGAGLAAAAGTTGQISGPFGALTMGIAAPLLIEQLARQIPLVNSSAGARATPPKGASGPSASVAVVEPAHHPQAGDAQQDESDHAT
jgi:hypothetical protein